MYVYDALCMNVCILYNYECMIGTHPHEEEMSLKLQVVASIFLQTGFEQTSQ